MMNSDIADQIREIRFQFVDKMCSLRLWTQQIMYSSKDDLTELLEELREIGKDYSENIEKSKKKVSKHFGKLEQITKENPHISKNLNKALSFFNLEKDGSFKQWYDIIYSGDIQIASDFIANGKGTQIMSEYDKAISELDEVHDSLRNISKFESLGILSDLIDEESYIAIKEALDIDISNLRENDVISFNKVFDARKKKDSEDLTIKVSGNEKGAKIESAANYFLSQNEKLSNIITKGYYPKPIKHGNLYITVQKKEKDNKEYDSHYYIASLALLYSYGKEILAENNIIIPECEIKSFEKILDEIDKKENSHKYRYLKNQYEEVLDKLKEIKEKGVIQSDNKKDNFSKGKILDLESLRIGKIPIGISLYLVQSELPIETWQDYVKTFLDVTQQETGKIYTPNDLINLTKLVKEAASITSIKELGGLYSRPMYRKQERKANIIRSFLNIT